MVLSLGEAKQSIGLESPVFENPPVVETTLGLRFAPVEGFNVVHFGQLIDTFRDHYPSFELKPPVGVVQLNFDLEATTYNPPARCWYINADKTQLVQVQADFFIRNWRATSECPDYQHYDRIRPLFVRDWELFSTFLANAGLKRPNIWQCEVSYINHLVRGRDWNTFSDLAKLFPIWRGLDPNRAFKTMEMAVFTAAFKLPDERSRIQFTLQPGVRTDGTEILQLTVTAAGQPPDQDNPTLYDWLDFGHLAVVNGFVHFTSDEAHKIWRKK
jgi:uncharacterized protein (TIGR04255 family)